MNPTKTNEEELKDMGYGFCPKCDYPLTNWGAASKGDGDIYDEIGCDRCEEIVEERHASYCSCPECEPYGINDSEDDYEQHGDLDCPNCGHEYDEIDYEYQICHFCKYNNNKKP